ncbi:flavin prenyltransferase UbiX [Sedimenticola selenatireducens]|uniref:Flavin prenyltransferase UbiX n=1 Tax=Sedimenticola selenatireducens TaxID=191960 RepID=A0A558DUN9_9GAMM|nr:flavin prenyltransferase UbiX [Sedimenticola selenatireducens]TVO72487.1 UbiX family flavin prenyltransferase [Sedimenticola selenatireducens]TVT64742.1 MAG: UbiX family flavin prenyltransferase [Sedimenticola selenatireducens]
MTQPSKPIALAITGASGAPYALRLLECLVQADRTVYVMISKAAQVVMPMETGLTIPSRPEEAEKLLTERFSAKPGQIRVFGREQWTAPVASGSNPPEAMVVCPCSTGTLSAIATGASNNLIERAADVVLKEQRKLILMVRETPFSPIHLENMLKLSRLGVVIMPASPGFYNRPQSIDEIVDFMVARVLSHLNIDNPLNRPWGG